MSCSTARTCFSFETTVAQPRQRWTAPLSRENYVHSCIVKKIFHVTGAGDADYRNYVITALCQLGAANWHLQTVARPRTTTSLRRSCQVNKCARKLLAPLPRMSCCAQHATDHLSITTTRLHVSLPCPPRNDKRLLPCEAT
jgi:hypothetical protein